MRRPRLLLLIALAQSALALFWIMATVFVAGSDRTALLACSLFALLSTIAAAAIWGRKLWGRWLAFASAAIPAAIMMLDLPQWFRRPEWDDIGIAAVFTGWAIFLLLPAIGRAFRETREAAAATKPAAS